MTQTEYNAVLDAILDTGRATWGAMTIDQRCAVLRARMLYDIEHHDQTDWLVEDHTDSFAILRQIAILVSGMVGQVGTTSAAATACLLRDQAIDYYADRIDSDLYERATVRRQAELWPNVHAMTRNPRKLELSWEEKNRVVRHCDDCV